MKHYWTVKIRTIDLDMSLITRDIFHRVHLEATVARGEKIVPVYYGTRRFIGVFTIVQMAQNLLATTGMNLRFQQKTDNWKEHEAGGNVKNFINFILRQILLGWSNQ
jgi:hypothetical protein